MNDNRSAGIAWDSAPRPRRRRRRWSHIVDLFAGGALVLARLIAPGVHGLLFKGSISQVQNICASGLGALAQADKSSMGQSCSDASTAMTVLNVAAAVGVLLLAVGGAYLLLQAIREAQHGAAG